jgi:hypothetical protein
VTGAGGMPDSLMKRAATASQPCGIGKSRPVMVPGAGKGQNPRRNLPKIKGGAPSICLMRDNPKIARIPLLDGAVMARVIAEGRIAISGRGRPACPSVAGDLAPVEEAECLMQERAPVHRRSRQGFLRHLKRWLVGS